MKKSVQDTILFDKDYALKNSLSISNNKTTNVNILLNRVRLDRKREIKKKIIFLSLLVLTISAVTIFAIN
jgi:hypothetical protein